MIRSALARTARRINQSSISRRCDDPAPQRVPPGGRGRGRRILSAGAEAPAHALDPGADPAGRAAGPDADGWREPLGPRRLCAGRGGGRRALTLLATGSEVSVALAAREMLARTASRRGRIDAVLGIVRGAARGLP